MLENSSCDESGTKTHETAKIQGATATYHQKKAKKNKIKVKRAIAPCVVSRCVRLLYTRTPIPEHESRVF